MPGGRLSVIIAVSDFKMVTLFDVFEGSSFWALRASHGSSDSMCASV